MPINTTRKNRNTTRVYSKPSMRSVYGEMVLKKGTQLYHVSDFEFCANPAKPMLFSVFHPLDIQDGPMADEYVTTITLKRDVSLFFMVSKIHNARILPLLDTLIGQPGQNLKKQSDANLACYIRNLKKENFDGWFSTINGRAIVEVALINDSSVFEISSCDLFVRNWNNINMNNTDITIPKKWGSKYEISVIRHQATLNINMRFKPEIEKYMKFTEETSNNQYIFQILLRNATLNYIDAPTAYIDWSC